MDREHDWRAPPSITEVPWVTWVPGVFIPWVVAPDLNFLYLVNGRLYSSCRVAVLDRLAGFVPEDEECLVINSTPDWLLIVRLFVVVPSDSSQVSTSPSQGMGVAVTVSL